jgi:hypothetical protein
VLASLVACVGPPDELLEGTADQATAPALQAPKVAATPRAQAARAVR